MTTINIKSTATWLLRLVAAVIMLQTLWFKFSASEESVYIFSTLGMEPWGRIGIGVMELIASILVLYPRTSVFGGVLAMGLMSGAIFFHLSKLGIEVMNDGGQLFAYAILVFAASLALVLMHRKQIYSLIRLKTKYWV
ncbi:MAG: DoxX family protein [Ferruginibacter sp.]